MAKKRRYADVSDLVRDLAPDDQFRAAFDEERTARNIVRDLVAVRALRGLSQQDIAKELDCTQSRISKLESSRDDELRLGDLRAYAKAVGCEIAMGAIPRDLNSADKVKCHVFAIKRHTDDLAKLARTDHGIAGGVAQFFFELVLNFGRLVGDSVKRLPKRPDDLPYFNFNLEVELKEVEPMSEDCPPPQDGSSACCVDVDRILGAAP